MAVIRSTFSAINHSINTSSPWAKAAILLIIAAGLIHFVVTPIHWAHAPAHGIFFLLAGVLQIAWGIAFWRRPSPGLYAVGWIIAGSLVTLWIVTRFWDAPFHAGPESVDLGGVVCKLAEILGLVSLIALAITGAKSAAQKRMIWQTLGLLLLFSIFVGLGTYGVARAAEPLFPGLAAHDHHPHSEQNPTHDHSHDDHSH